MDAVKLFLDYHHRTSRLPQGKRVTESLAAHLGKVGSLLDVGCGDGTNTRRLADASGATRVVGVEVQPREHTQVPIEPYDGRNLPFPDRSFDAVSLVDVLHHCEDPQRVLDEAVRVARTMVVVKDHFAFGPVTRKLLYWMDIVGNAKARVPTPGTYFALRDWVRMVDRAHGRIAAIDWPLKTHDLPWRLVGWPELQFTAKIVPVATSS
ncbi:MAG TPA: class I SAM-dependent methyltransferase [Polyangiaceae bacterium]|nr:class I SAM-dependent methyltransferase [Polyangiaceae bacterium]